jgi:hypothetical protein
MRIWISMPACAIENSPASAATNADAVSNESTISSPHALFSGFFSSKSLDLNHIAVLFLADAGEQLRVAGLVCRRFEAEWAGLLKHSHPLQFVMRERRRCDSSRIKMRPKAPRRRRRVQRTPESFGRSKQAR